MTRLSHSINCWGCVSKETKANGDKTKANLEFLLVKAEVKGIPEKGLLRSRNIGQVDLELLGRDP